MRINFALFAALVLACGIASASEAADYGSVARGALTVGKTVGKWAGGSWLWDQLFREDNDAQAAEADICETDFGSCVLPDPGPRGESCYCYAADGMPFEGISR